MMSQIISTQGLITIKRRLRQALTLSCLTFGAALSHADAFDSMPNRIERFLADRGSLQRFYDLDYSVSDLNRHSRFLSDTLLNLDTFDFAALTHAEQVDWLLFQNQLKFDLEMLELKKSKLNATRPWLPFIEKLEPLFFARRNVNPIDPRQAGETLESTIALVKATQSSLKGADKEKKEDKVQLDQATPEMANRAARWTRSVIQDLREWNRFYEGYDPLMSWWTKEPLPKLITALEDYEKALKEKAVPDGDPDKIIGDPIGREALLKSLKAEFIPYTPEELIQIAEQEFAWCEKEMKRVSDELGFSGDWKATLDYVEEKHVAPGEQPALIKFLAHEAEEFLEARNLLTIPPLAKESWRMIMMTPERQRVSPYFTGGEVISVSFPTDTMDHESKQMSLWGNNIHFSRATVQHELIPGHHLQLFMADRYNTHRSYFRTPFLVEGWALYWEMLLWDLNFPLNAQDQVGMLFWRSHRCARIIFSLSYHLEKMTADEAVDFLVDRVGHERRNAAAEVRRSVSGGYSPLYQAAYMLGGLQIRSMRRELVESGDWTDRDFHDAILKENAIPISLIRASLKQSELKPDTTFEWRFYDDVQVESASSETDSDEQAKSPSIQQEKETHTSNPSAVSDPQIEKDLKKKFGGSLEDYQRANAYRKLTQNRVFRDDVNPNWINNNAFWYRIEVAPSKLEHYWVEATSGERLLVFESGQLLEALKKIDPDFSGTNDPAIQRIERNDNSEFRVQTENGWLDWNAETLTLSRSATPIVSKDSETGESESNARNNNRRRDRRSDDSLVSPDGKFRADVYGHNLRILDSKSQAALLQTYDANPDNSFEMDTDWQRRVNMRYDLEKPNPARPEVYWSPDSQWVAAIQTQVGVSREVTLVDTAPDNALQPTTLTYPYLKPGDAIPTQTIRIFHVPSGKEIQPNSEEILTPWRLSHFRWADDSSEFFFQYNQRGHQTLKLLSVRTDSGQTRVVIHEHSETFIDYAYKNYLRWIKNGEEVLWFSERSGWNHLYRYDVKTGNVLNPVTQGEWVLRSVEYVDEEAGAVYIQASGVYADQDPYYFHYGRVNLDGTGLTWLTEGDGTHEVEWSPDRSWLVDSYSRVDLPSVTELRSGMTGELMAQLEVADDSLLQSINWSAPERFTALGRDGVTKIYGVIYRPGNFEKNQKYPVIEKIYAGPHGAFVPKSFRAYHSAQAMAELGFIVLQIDGMGTNHRSKAFHDVCWKNIGDSGFADRRLWMESAAKIYPEMDLSRVGIYGGSAGGQSALRALLAHGDFYHAAVADCGCHDNRIDKIWWNELWMGWPVGPHYDEQSNVTQAGKLEGDLLLVVGELDKNVDPASTFQVVDALIQEDKDFDLLVVPGAGHGAAESPYGSRRRQDFFVEKLLEVKPRWSN